MPRLRPPNAPIPVVFDTSVLRTVSVSKQNPEFNQLRKLAKSGKIILQMPEFVERERVSQLAQSALEAVAELATAINKVFSQASLKDSADVRAAVKAVGSDAAITKLKAEANAWHKRQLGELGVQTLPLEQADTAAVMDLYFAGAPPFRKVKAREDLPDGFVYVAVKRCFEQDERTIFVCNDGGLRKAAEALGMTTVQSLPDLLQLPLMARFHLDATFAAWWSANFIATVDQLKQLQPRIFELMPDRVVDAVGDMTIVDSEIPEDNHEASVASVGDASDFQIAWDKAVSLGEGIISVPVEFEVDIDLEFSVYRSDSFSVPKWVSVSFGDPESNHYFDAYGEQTGRFAGRLVMTFGSEIQKSGLNLSGSDISLEDVTFKGFA